MKPLHSYLLAGLLSLHTAVCSADRQVIEKLENELPDYSVTTEFQKHKPTYPYIEIVKEKTTKTLNAEKNIVYANIGERKLHLDIFQPRYRKTALPAVVLVHGGGWRTGDRSYQIPMAQALAEAGYIAVTVEYRLSREALYPAGIHDLQAAIRWLRTHHQQYRINPDKIAILGASSGAHMATLIGTTGNLRQFAGELIELDGVSSQVQAVINLDGVVDIVSPKARLFEDKPGKTSYFALWLGGRYKEYPSLWREASPSTYVGKTTPPTLFVNSAHDRFHVGRDNYINSLKRYGTYNEVHTIPDTPHTFWLFDPWFTNTSEIVIGFLDRVFKSQQKQPSNTALSLSDNTAIPLNENQLAMLPSAEKQLWLSYIAKSNKTKRQDLAALINELNANGLKNPLPAIALTKELKGSIQKSYAAGVTIDNKTVANILSWQTPSGGWSKNTDVYTQPRKPGQNFGIETSYIPTFDNDATFEQINLLSRVYKTRPNEELANSLIAAINLLLTAQFPTGGWPQTYPLAGNYHDWTTYNDDVMTNILKTYLNITEDPAAYAVNDKLLAKVKLSLDKAVNNIIADQIMLDENTGGWGQQHDPISHDLRAARAFEMAALATMESARLLKQLMRIESPGEALKKAIHSGIAWLERSKLEKLRWQLNGEKNSELVFDENAPYLWPRMINPNTEKAVFGDRDGSIHSRVQDISLERQNKYAWYHASPNEALKEYSVWKKKHKTPN